jgi:AcrR family transcriptional regulator
MPKPDLRQSILDTARELFIEKGPRNTTLDDISRRMHRTKTFFYHYFESKDDLLRALIEVESGEFQGELRSATEAEGSANLKLRAYVHARFDIFHRIGALYWASQERYLEQYGFIENARKNFDQFEIGFVAKILSEGVDKGEFRIRDPELVSRVLIVALKGFESEWITATTADFEKTIDAVLSIFFDGIAAKRVAIAEEG